MNEPKLFEEKTVPQRTMSKWELDEKRELARKYGIKDNRMAQVKNFDNTKTQW